MSSIVWDSRVKNALGDWESFYKISCDCGQFGVWCVLESKRPGTYTCVCSQLYHVDATGVGTVDPYNPNATTFTVSRPPPGHIQWIPTNTQIDPTPILWDGVVVGWQEPEPKLEPTECYCFGPPVDDCPIHGKKK